jgi:hypothetical protein
MSAPENNSIRGRESEDRKNHHHRANSSEQLAISSGKLLVIDQFMLANKQLIEQLESDSIKTDELLGNYGGCLLDLTDGDYYLLRDPRIATITIVSQKHLDHLDLGISEVEPTDFLVEREEISVKGRVFVDTRCIVFADHSLLENSDVISEYCQKREKEDDKKARDFLRQKGAAVRYGFNRYGDELAVGTASIDGHEIVLIWPDVTE